MPSLQQRVHAFLATKQAAEVVLTSCPLSPALVPAVLDAVDLAGERGNGLRGGEAAASCSRREAKPRRRAVGPSPTLSKKREQRGRR